MPSRRVSGPRPPSLQLDSCSSELASPEAAMTPKQRMAARKRAAADLRLQQMKAHMDAHTSSDCKQAQSRRSHMIGGSLHGAGFTPGLGRVREPPFHVSHRPPPLLIDPEISTRSPAEQGVGVHQTSARGGRACEPLPGGGLEQVEGGMDAGRSSAAGFHGLRHNSTFLVLVRWVHQVVGCWQCRLS